MTQMLLWVTIAFSWITVGWACTCVSPRDENYCNSDIVFRGRVVSEQPGEPYPWGKRIYVVEVDKIFRSTSSFVGTTFNLTTARSSATCGSYFELNTAYVIAASGTNGQLSTNLCAGNTVWNSLNENRKMFFTHRLRKLCASANALNQVASLRR